MYINYATEHWRYPGENSPIGLILCSQKDKELAHYALGNFRNIAAIEHKINHSREALISEMEQAQKFYFYQYDALALLAVPQQDSLSR
jgi:hypothetical protein